MLPVYELALKLPMLPKGQLTAQSSELETKGSFFPFALIYKCWLTILEKVFKALLDLSSEMSFLLNPCSRSG